MNIWVIYTDISYTIYSININIHIKCCSVHEIHTLQIWYDFFCRNRFIKKKGIPKQCNKRGGHLQKFWLCLRWSSLVYQVKIHKWPNEKRLDMKLGALNFWSPNLSWRWVVCVCVPINGPSQICIYMYKIVHFYTYMYISHNLHIVIYLFIIYIYARVV